MLEAAIGTFLGLTAFAVLAGAAYVIFLAGSEEKRPREGYWKTRRD